MGSEGGIISSGIKELCKEVWLQVVSSRRSKERLYKDSQRSDVEENEERENTTKGSALKAEYISEGYEIYDDTVHLLDAWGNKLMIFIKQAPVGTKEQDKLHGPYHTWGQSEINEFIKEMHEQAKKYYWSCYKRFVPDTKLDERTAKFMYLICNASMKEDQMMATGYDAEKLPLDKLTEPIVIKVESLGEIEVALKLLKDCAAMEEEDPLLSLYKLLRCELTPVEVGSEEFDMIRRYMNKTHAKTHSSYTCEIVQIFKASRDAEADNFSEFSNTKSRMLLWHGSPLINWVGILSQGLRIAPPEARVSGEMFGKGVYFADMFSKSAQFCRAFEEAPNGVLLLCEVELGEMAELLKADNHADMLPPGKLSTKGVGETGPNMPESETLEDGVVVPLGHPIEQLTSKVDLSHNEYAVYNVNQIRIRWVVHVNFIFKDDAGKEAPKIYT